MTARLKSFALSTAFAACAVMGATTVAVAAPPQSGPGAPELTGSTQWLNSEPRNLQQLRGKVVLIDFWTYTCINCVNTLPYVKSWNQKYKDQGLTVIGVHTHEYQFERDTGNVKTANKRLGISYQVAQDNQYATWNDYDKQYWPAFYLIDKKGQIVYSHFGEGAYAQTEAKIQALLAQKN